MLVKLQRRTEKRFRAEALMHAAVVLYSISICFVCNFCCCSYFCFCVCFSHYHATNATRALIKGADICSLAQPSGAGSVLGAKKSCGSIHFEREMPSYHLLKSLQRRMSKRYALQLLVEYMLFIDFQSLSSEECVIGSKGYKRSMFRRSKYRLKHCKGKL